MQDGLGAANDTKAVRLKLCSVQFIDMTAGQAAQCTRTGQWGNLIATQVVAEAGKGGDCLWRSWAGAAFERSSLDQVEVDASCGCLLASARAVIFNS
jgi:hypothetical protein